MTGLCDRRSFSLKNKVLAFCVLILAASCLHDLGTSPVQLTIQIKGAGTVTLDPDDSLFVPGSTVRLVAKPDSGNMFVRFEGDAQSLQNELSFLLLRTSIVTAVFMPNPTGPIQRIAAKNRTFAMGSAGALSQQNERPVHSVTFDYDFYLGRTEVTQKEFHEVMGTLPVLPGSTTDAGPPYPVYNVSWYDAVRYCNRLSSMHGYDTVYSYTAFCDAPGCETPLENLIIHYERAGFRLPTEAEWEYGARAGTTEEFSWGSSDDSIAARYAWFFGNALDHAREAGTLRPNNFGLFDMAGNVAEWVNDWFDYYRDSAVINPVGPTHLYQAQFEQTFERPVRGGSWRLGTAFLRPGCRRGPYATSAFVAQRDIGFRVAFGPFAPKAAKPPVLSANSFTITLACSKKQLLDFARTSRLKFAFATQQQRRSTLVYIDFTSPYVAVRQCGNDTLIFGTSLSPDGKHVAYSSRGEGFSSPGVFTIRGLDSLGSNPVRASGYLPRFWVSPSTPDTFVVFSDGAAVNDIPRWHQEKTYKQRFGNGLLAGTPMVLRSDGSYHGGLSSDGRFLGTSYTVARLVDMKINDTNIFYFEKPFNGRLSDAQKFPQVCNLSMSPSRASPGEALLLDFGYSGTSSLIGKPYGLHEYIFICNAKLLTSEHVEKWFEKPVGYDQWDFPEYSNHPGFIVAIAKRATDTGDAVYLINKVDSSYLKIATGTNLSHPACWIDPNQAAEEDDPYRWFGAYDIPVQWGGHAVLAKKLRLFWNRRESVECVCLGSSPVMWAVRAPQITLPFINMAAGGSDILTSVFLAREYVLPHAPRVKAIILDLIPAFFDRDAYTTVPRLNGLYESIGYELDAANDFYKNALPDRIRERAASFTGANWIGYDSMGYVENRDNNGWGNPVINKKDYDFNNEIVQSCLAQIKALADSAAARKIVLLIVNMPENPRYAETAMIGYLGPSWVTYKKIAEWVRALEKANPYVHFYDANNDGNHDYTDSEAMDQNHLNSLGGIKFSKRLDSLLQGYLEGK